MCTLTFILNMNEIVINIRALLELFSLLLFFAIFLCRFTSSSSFLFIEQFFTRTYNLLCTPFRSFLFALFRYIFIEQRAKEIVDNKFSKNTHALTNGFCFKTDFQRCYKDEVIFELFFMKLLYN